MDQSQRPRSTRCLTLGPSRQLHSAVGRKGRLRSISNTLEKGRKQLPADRPGAIFLKVPQSWVADTAIAAEMVQRGPAFFRNTDRIISVKFYVSHLMIGDGMIMHRHAVREITNERSKFNDGRNWDLFTDHPVPLSWNGMPPKWQRLFFFPKSQ